MKASLFLFLFLFLFLLQCFSSASASVLDEMCAKAWDEDMSADYCLNVMKAEPRSETADANTLVSIANHLTAEKLRANYAKVKELQSKEGNTPQQQSALDICENSYSLAVLKMDQVEERYQTGGFLMSTNYVSSAMDKVVSCVDAFIKIGIPSPIQEDNEDAIHMIHQVAKFTEP